MQNNKVMLIGHVGQHLKTRKLDSAGKRVDIRVATHDKQKNKKGTVIDHTVWHDVVAWNNMAEYAERSFVKGSKILVEGCIEHRTYPDLTGHVRYITIIKAQSLLNLDR